VFYEPQSLLGGLNIALAHPWAITAGAQAKVPRERAALTGVKTTFAHRPTRATIRKRPTSPSTGIAGTASCRYAYFSRDLLEIRFGRPERAKLLRDDGDELMARPAKLIKFSPQ
jgi:hypothetical protein